MAENKFGAQEINDPEMFAALLNKQFAKYNELLTATATKSEIRQMQADLIVENKSLLDRLTAEGDKAEGLKKQLADLNETITIQGETITKLKTAFNPGQEKKSFRSAVFEQLQKGIFNDFISEKTGRAKMLIDLKDLAFTGTYGSGAAQQAFMPFGVPIGPDVEDFDIRMVVPTGTIDSEKLEYPQERSASLTNNMAFVTENDETTANAFGFTMATANTKRATAHIKVSRRAMRNSAWLANYINMRLMQQFIAKLNTAVVADDGSPSTELSGLLNNANTFAGTDFSSKFANADYFSVLRAARGEMKKTYKRNPNTVFMDPVEFAVLSDARTTIGDFISANPALSRDALGFNNISGMKVWETADITDGGYLVADIAPSTVQLLFNGPIEILASDSDDDNFTKNLITLKIEADVMLPIYNTNAFLKGTFETDLGTILKGA